jgi:hypothetical protein
MDEIWLPFARNNNADSKYPPESLATPLQNLNFVINREIGIIVQNSHML